MALLAYILDRTIEVRLLFFIGFQIAFQKTTSPIFEVLAIQSPPSYAAHEISI
jgi:hypothetical protein